MNPDESECLGCFTSILLGFMEAEKETDVDVSFWVTQSAYDQGLYERIIWNNKGLVSRRMAIQTSILEQQNNT